MLRHGKAKGKRKYSSMTISIHLLFDEKGRELLKSTLIRSKTLVAFVSVSSCILWDLGFSSVQDKHTQRTSSVEKGKLFICTKCKSFITPGPGW